MRGADLAVSAWERYWFDPVIAARPYVLMRVVYAVIALDLWLVQVPTGARYGVDGFNVAHFRWLDALQPLPGPALYVGLVLSVGWLALVCALADPGRWARVLVAVGHTYSWAMSLHDSYQHHYFLSLVLILFVFFPRLRVHDVAAPGPVRTVSAWAYVLLGATVTVVYAFAAVAKLDPTWRAGTVLKQMQFRPEVAAVEAWLAGHGVADDVFWSAMSLGVVAVEWSIAAAYLVAVRRDAVPRRWIAWVAWLGFALAAGLHVNAEVVMNLSIGWFSYYMLVFAAVYFLPGGALAGVARVAVRPAAWLDRVSGRVAASGGWVAVAVGALLALGAGLAIDLPGGVAAGIAAAGLLVVASAAARLVGGWTPGIGYPVAVMAAAIAMCATTVSARTQYDYYMAEARILDRLGRRPAVVDAVARARRYGTPSVAGIWGSAGSRLEVTVRDGVATGVFLALGEDAQSLGFKVGDVSFVARVDGSHLEGEQTIRYRDHCYPEGRRVPMIARLGLAGNVLSTHCYSLDLDQACQDAGPYQVVENTWGRESR